MTYKDQGNKIAVKWAENLTGDNPYLSEAGECLRFIRVGVQEALGNSAWPVPQGLDAKQAFAVMSAKGFVLPHGANTMPGDICFWVGPEHGKHGHVAGRIFGNKIAENSSLHVGGGDTDARGTRPLPGEDSTCIWVRLPLR